MNDNAEVEAGNDRLPSAKRSNQGLYQLSHLQEGHPYQLLPSLRC